MARSRMRFNPNIGQGVQFAYDYKKEFWQWFNANLDDVVVKVGWWVVSFTITVEDLEPFFERLFGKNPGI